MKILYALLRIVLGVILRGFVFQSLWLWIIIPIIPIAPVLPLAFAIGITTIIAFATQYTPWYIIKEEQEYTKNHSEIAQFGFIVFRPLVYLMIGFIISFFI